VRIVKYVLQILVLFVFIIGAVTIWRGAQSGNWFTNWLAQTTQNDQSTHSLVLEEVTSMGKLELVKYNFKDVVEQEIVRQWFPNSKAILIVQGEAVGCIDLTLLHATDIQTARDTLILHLPAPELCVFKVDHSRSKVYNTEYTFLDESKLIEEAYRQAEVQIRNAALEMGILDQAKDNAKKVLSPLLEKTSGKPVVIHFPPTAKVDRPK
jgi:hypothetical protein